MQLVCQKQKAACMRRHEIVLMVVQPLLILNELVDISSPGLSVSNCFPFLYIPAYVISNRVW